MSDLWTLDDLKAWTRSLLATRRVIAPVARPEGAVWAQVDDPDAVSWGYGRTTISPREWLLPRHEVLFRYDLSGDPPRIEEPEISAPPTALLLVRPCDVAGLRALDAVMRWDYTEEGFEARRAATLLIALGCSRPASPESCFCGSVGLDPRWAPEADVMIEPIEGPSGTRYRVAPLTEAGRASLEGMSLPLAAPQPIGPPVATVPIDIERAREWMRGHFEDELWVKAAESCLGCGACAYLCPSCHCFDVVDEGDWRRGVRVRNWDSCAFSHFTLHATGHNPRPKQVNRYRQRLYHKFQYYPDKFGRLLCTGCGRCVDSCSGGMDLIEVLQECAAREESRV